MTDGPSDDGTGEDGARDGAGEAPDRGANRLQRSEREAEDAENGGADAAPSEEESEVTDEAPEGTDGASESTGDGAATAGEDSETADGVTESADEASDIADAESESADGNSQAADGEAEATETGDGPPASDVPTDVRKYDKFKKIDGGTYDRANEFLRDRTYVTAREWAIARLCADFRTETGVEMTKIGENLPQLVPFMTDTYSPQAVNQARASFEEKVRKSGATFLYGAMCDFFTAQELDDVMYEATEVAKFLLEVEGVELSVDEELEAEDRISEVMREVREHSAALRHDEMSCPECGHEMSVEE